MFETIFYSRCLVKDDDRPTGCDMNLLTAEELAHVTDLLAIEDLEGISPKILADQVCGNLLRNFLVIDRGLAGDELSAEDWLYNRYYWYRRFADAHYQRFGSDAGVDQKAAQILESAGFEPDWSVIDQIEKLLEADS